MTPRLRSDDSLEALFQRYRERGDAGALAEIYDLCAPGLLRLASKLAGRQRREWAEDALQETFLALVERPDRFDASQPLLPWLTSVLVRRLRDLERKAARRPSAQRVAKHREEIQVPDPAEEISRGELYSEVDRAVAELPASMRLVVEGKLEGTAGTAELARELGITPGSFRVRFHRALARLRDRIPQSLLGAVALISTRERALAATRAKVLQASGVPLSTAIPLSLGALAMAKKLVIVSVAILAGLLMWRPLLWEANAPEPLKPRLDSSDSSAPPSSPGFLLASSQDAVAEDSDDPVRSALGDRDALIIVQASLAATGEAMEGETVTLYFERAGAYDSLQARTDRKGEARLSVDPERNILGLALEPGAEHAGGSYRNRLRLGSGEERVIEIRARLGGAVSGTVVDRSGHAVPGAKVLGWCIGSDEFPHHREVSADTEGRFTVEHLGPRFVLKAVSEFLAFDQGLRGELAEGQEIEGVELVLTTATELRGRVLNEVGLPVAGARVLLRNGVHGVSARNSTAVPGIRTFQGGQGRDITDEEGRFVLGRLPRVTGSGHPFFHSLTIQHPDYDMLETISAGGGSPERDYVLKAPVTLLGQVFDRFGRPAAGAVVRGAPLQSTLDGTSFSVICDEEGSFVHSGFRNPNRRQRLQTSLRVLHEGHAVHVEEGFDPSAYRVRPLEIRLGEAEKRLAGRVIDANRHAVSGALVSVEGSRVCSGSRSRPVRTWERFSDLAEVRTDRDGSFEFRKLYPGDFRLRVVDPENTQRIFEKSYTAGAVDLEIMLTDELTEPVVLQGAVHSIFGNPVTSFKVGVFATTEGKYQEFTTEDGSFELGGLLPGSYEIFVEAPGFAGWARAEQWLGRGVNMILAELEPCVSLEVQLTGESIENVIYKLEPKDRQGNAVPFQSVFSSFATHIETSKGRAILHRLPAREIVLCVSNAQFSQEFEVDLTVPMEGPLVLEVHSLPGAAVWVQLTEGNGEPTSDFHLVFEGVDQSVLAMVFRGEGDENQTQILQRFAYSCTTSIEDLNKPFRVRLPEGESVLRLHAGTAPGRILDISSGRYTESAPLEIDLGGL